MIPSRIAIFLLMPMLTAAGEDGGPRDAVVAVLDSLLRPPGSTMAGEAIELHEGPPARLPEETKQGTPMSSPSSLAEIIRLNPHLSRDDPMQLPMKIRGLLEDEYKFFRGTADLFYDFCRPACGDWLEDRSSHLLLHGDLHLGNIGTYRTIDATELTLAFSVVDLDEAVRGPFQLDLLRALTSLRAVATAQGIRVSDQEWDRIARLLVAGYRSGLSARKTEPPALRHKRVQHLLREAEKADARAYLNKYTTIRGQRRFLGVRLKDGRPADLMRPVDRDRRREVIDALWESLSAGDGRDVPVRLRFLNHGDLQQAVMDVAEWTRLESSGSQGLRKYLVLLDRPTSQQDRATGLDTEPIIVQLKEQPTPAAARAGLLSAAWGPNRAKEVADAYRQLVEPDRWLAASLTFGNRGFVQLTKDAWGEEFSAKAFASLDGLGEAARILGEATGWAHRSALTSSHKNRERIDHFATAADDALADVLCERSAAAAEYMHRLFENLQRDPQAKALANAAEKAIRAAVRQPASDPTDR